MKTKILFYCLILCSLGILYAQETTSFDEQLVHFCDTAKALDQKNLLDGPVLVTKGDKVLLNLKNNKKEPPQYMIGSVSKQFLSVDLLKAFYEKAPGTTSTEKTEWIKQQVQLPLSHFLPAESPLWDNHMPQWATSVTLHQLFTHTSGIQDCLEVAKDKWIKSYHTPQELIKLICDYPLRFEPGTKFSYSNTNYLLLAEILEVLTHKSFADRLHTSLFVPLGMNDTFNPEKGSPKGELQKEERFKRLVYPMNYNLKGDQHKLYPAKKWIDASVAKGGGAIVSTAYDLLSWNKALHVTQSILPEELYTLFTTPVLSNYGYGIAIFKTSVGTILIHDGQIGAFKAYLTYVKEQDTHIIFLANADFDEKPLTAEFMALMKKLKAKIPDEIERSHVVEQMLLEKYPSRRSMPILYQELRKLLDMP